MEHSYETLMWDEMGDLGKYLRSLDAPQWDQPSLCEGWAVRDVIGHMCVGHTTPLPKIVGSMVRYGFNVPKGSFEMSKRFAAERSPDELLAVWDDIVANHIRKGISTKIPIHEGFVDHLIHHQDIRRPLGAPREIPAERLVGALDALGRIGGFMKSKQRLAGLRLVASDLDWSRGDGPEVRGPAEALILTASGRPVALDELSGDGVATLRQRVAA